MAKSTIDTIFEQLRSGMDRLRPAEMERVDPWGDFDVPAIAEATTVEDIALDPGLRADLQRAWTASARYGVTLSVIVFGSAVAHPDPEMVRRSIETGLRRPQDRCHVLDDDRHVLLLDDYPLMLACYTANRIILAAKGKEVALKAGIATINAVGPLRDDCIQCAATALAGVLDQTDRRIAWVDLRPKQKRLPIAS